jgi:hypothetical protein
MDICQRRKWLAMRQKCTGKDLPPALPWCSVVNLVGTPGIEVDMAFSISTKLGRPI